MIRTSLRQMVMMETEVCNENPLRKANYISKLSFWWLKDIVRRGEKGNLEPNDIYNTTPENLSAPLGHTLETAWEKERNDAKLTSVKPSLSRVIIKTYYRHFLKLTSLQVFYVIILKSMIQPLFLEMIMLYLDSSEITMSEAYGYATISIILMAFRTLLFRHGSFYLNQLGMQIKIAVSSLIYKKITKLPCSYTSRNESVSAINLLSIDVSRFEILIFYLAFTAILPLQLFGVTYLVHTYVGLIASLTGIALMILQTIPLQMLHYKLTLKWRAEQATNTDKRISLIDEIVAGVRAIKMYAWENCFQKLVFRARNLEIQGFLKIAYLSSVPGSLMLASHRVCTFVMALIYFLQYRMITAEKVLTVRQHFHYLRIHVGSYFFQYMQKIANMRVSIKRIEDFLTLPEKKFSTNKIENLERVGTILVKNVTAFWDETTEDTVLKNVSVDFLPRNVYAILGATGSGKSSLLNLILGELEPISGQVSVAGEISYASQEPWLFAASIRENILFSRTYEIERYGQVVSACALVDDFNNLPYGDQTLVGDRGMSLSGGQRSRINLARAVYCQADLYILDDPFLAVDTRVAKMLRSQCIERLLKDKTVIIVTHNLHYLGKDDHVVLLNSGKIQFAGNFIDYQTKNELTQLQYPKEADAVEFAEELDDQENNDASDHESNASKYDENTPLNENEEIRAQGSLSKSVFSKYAKSGGYASLLTVLAAYTLAATLMFKFDFDLSAWAEVEGSHIWRNQTPEYESNVDENASDSSMDGVEIPVIVISSSCILSLIVATIIVRNVLLYRFVYTSNRNLHNDMFESLIRTPMRFFELNPAGRILNRFSEDIGSLDNNFHESVEYTLTAICEVVGSLILTVVTNWRNIVPVTLTNLLFMRISCVYMEVVPKIKRLVGTAKSPTLNFVTSTLAGLTTIRSCKAENFVMDEFAGRLDKHTAANFLLLAFSSALTVWVDLLVVGLFACAAYISIALKNNGMPAAQAGLALTAIIEIIGCMSFMMRMFADTCALMTNVERVLQYTELEPEDFVDKKPTDEMSESWPSRGEIRFERVNLRYSAEDQPVLRDLSFCVEAAAKVGIVGRTGAGKSSLVTALFRLASVDGQIFIDNVDTQKVDLAFLRSKISIIPQEPILFSATLRSNLDPLNEFDDSTLWSALDSVGLKKPFLSLDQVVEKAGKNLSLGQRQLLCLARVAVKNNKILVLDEATANVDSVSDAQIQETIREKFKSCTVLTIAHRLNTIMDNDKVLVMDHGQVVEYDHPHVLLQNCDGYLSKMVEQTGESVSQQLKEIAKNAYNRLQI